MMKTLPVRVRPESAGRGVASPPMDTSARRIAHLYRRAGFGAGPDELAAAVALGFEAVVARLTDPATVDAAADAVPVPELTPPGAEAGTDVTTRQRLQRAMRAERVAVTGWWLDRMVASEQPLKEKLTLLWHGHFATSIEKVTVPKLMLDQNVLFRTLGSGRFDQLTQAVAKDPAMLVWLDSNTNRVGHPNENFARELMELFTLGIGNYTETDVREVARAFTGWSFDRRAGHYQFRPRQHDDGQKTVLGRSGPFNGEEVIDQLTHSPASARFVVARLWSHLAYPVAPGDPVVSDLLAGFTADLDITSLIRRTLLHPAFVSDMARAGLVKQPIEYVVGALRALRVPPDAPIRTGGRLVAVLRALGQVPFEPPSVGGWPQNAHWLSTAASLARLGFATSLSQSADLSVVEQATPGDRPAVVARTLSVEWSPVTAAALHRLTDDPRSLVALALVSPEYVMN